LAAVAAFLFGCSESSGPLPTPPANPAAGIRVGTRAHEISGEDLLGQPMKLSDYRGQVVLLDFWGNW
jgi:cytochrome oxidase Cu insertion factor (SCO1/SenC/PrrC family)